MTAQATYLLATGQHNQKICYHIRWDGYPKGAAYYFWLMHKCQNSIGYAARFLLANNNAQFTPSHETHQKTKYRYEIDEEGVLTAWTKESIFNESWKVIYQGTWYNFVNQYLQHNALLYPFKRLYFTNIDFIMTLFEARAWVKEKMSCAEAAHHKGFIEYSASLKEKANYMQHQIDKIDEHYKNNGLNVVKLSHHYNQNKVKRGGENGGF